MTRASTGLWPVVLIYMRGQVLLFLVAEVQLAGRFQFTSKHSKSHSGNAARRVGKSHVANIAETSLPHSKRMDEWSLTKDSIQGNRWRAKIMIAFAIYRTDSGAWMVFRQQQLKLLLSCRILKKDYVPRQNASTVGVVSNPIKSPIITGYSPQRPAMVCPENGKIGEVSSLSRFHAAHEGWFWDCGM